MTWVLFDNADEKLMLVKKKNNNGPKRKPAARNLQAASESSQLTLPLPLPMPAIDQSPRVSRADTQVSAKSILPAFEPPPPYSPRQHCHCDNELSKPSVPVVSLPLARIPPPLPPRAPSHGQDAVRSAAGLQLGKSCPDLARLVAKSVQNVKASMNQEQDKKAIVKAIKNEKGGIIQGYEKKATSELSANATRTLNEEHGKKKALAKPSRDFAEITSQERDKRNPPSKLPRPTDSSRHVSDQRPLPAKPFSPPTALEDLISTKLDNVLTSIDGEAFSGDEKELGRLFKSTDVLYWPLIMSQISTTVNQRFVADGALQTKSPKAQIVLFHPRSSASTTSRKPTCTLIQDYLRIYLL